MPTPEEIQAVIDARKAERQGIPISSTKVNWTQRVLTPLGTTLDALDTDLNYVTNALRPVVTALNPKLDEIYNNAPKKFGVPNVTPADLIEKGLEDTPGRKYLAPILGWAANVAMSPSTYIAGLGIVTKEGKLFQNIASLTHAGIDIAPESKIAGEIALHYGEQKATPKLIQQAIKEAKTVVTPSLAEQALTGQRALISIGIPFTKQEIPAIRGQLFYRGLDSAKDFLNKSKFGEAFNKLFSTSSGNPVFDGIRHKALGTVYFREGAVKEYATDLAKRIQQFADDAGIDYSEAHAMISTIGESKWAGKIDADSVIKTFETNINNQFVEKKTIDDIVQSLPQTHLMTKDELGKLNRRLLGLAKEKQSGLNVFTTTFLQLPETIRNQFVKEFTDGLGIKVAKDLKKIKKGVTGIEYADMPSVVQAYNQGLTFAKGKSVFGKVRYLSKGGSIYFEPGTDAGLFALVGKDEYIRLRIAETQGDVLKGRGLPPGVATEAGAMRDVVQRIVAHVDQGFSTAYTLHQISPKYLEQISPRLSKLMKMIDSNDNWKVQGLVDQFKIPIQLAREFPKAFDYAQEIRGFMKSQIDMEIKAGLPGAEFMGKLGYIPHVPTREAKKLIEKYGGNDFRGSSREWNIRHTNMLQRKMRTVDPNAVHEAFNTGIITEKERNIILGKNGDAYIQRLVDKKLLSDSRAAQLYNYLSIKDVNRLAAQGKLKLINGEVIDKFFDTNPAYQVLVRGIRGEKARTAMDFYNSAKQFGEYNDVRQNLPEGKRYVTNAYANPLAKQVRVNGVKSQLMFDTRVAQHIDRLHEALIIPPAQHPFLKHFDNIQALWKAWTLSIFPAYHTRNVIGNIWNNYLAGIHTIEPYQKALRIQHGADIVIQTGSGGLLDSKAIMKLAQERGLINTGQFWGDVEEYFRIEMKGGIKSVYQKTAGRAVSAGLKVGNYFENNAKLALFIRRLEEGFSPNDAAMEVKKYLFDYSNLTNFERETLRRVFPFFTWTRFNVPLQLEALATHPTRLLAVQKAKNALETNYDGVPDERLLPDYFVQSFPVRTRYDPKNKRFEYFFLNSWLPAADIDKLFNPVAWMKTQLTPLLKEPIQQVANRDFFTDREIDQGDDYQTLRILSGLKFDLSARQVHVLKNIRFISELDRLNDPQLGAWSKIVKILTGKLYPFNPEQETIFREKEYTAKLSRLEYQASKAAEQGNAHMQEKILNKLNEVAANPNF